MKNKGLNITVVALLAVFLLSISAIAAPSGRKGGRGPEMGKSMGSMGYGGSKMAFRGSPDTSGQGRMQKGRGPAMQGKRSINKEAPENARPRHSKGKSRGKNKARQMKGRDQGRQMMGKGRGMDQDRQMMGRGRGMDQDRPMMGKGRGMGQGRQMMGKGRGMDQDRPIMGRGRGGRR